MRQFNVINNMYGRFEKYDVINRLRQTWEFWEEKWAEYQNDPDIQCNPDDYLRKPETDEEIARWVTKELKYIFWGKCEWEMILSPWPYRHLEDGTPILKQGEYKKIDVWDQCEMNLDLIIQIFIEDVARGSAQD